MTTVRLGGRHTTTPGLEDIAAEIQLIADRGGQERMPIAWLAAELRDGGHRLAGVDLVSAFSPETLLPDTPVERSGFAEFLAVIRDLVVFAPVGITWWVLRGAVSAWNKSGTNQSLLKYWESNPGKVVPISQSALWVVEALLAVGILTIVVAILDRRAERQNSRRADREALGTQLALATMELAAPAPKNHVSDTTLVRMTDRIYQGNQSLSTTLTKVGDDLRTALDSGPTSGIATALNKWNSSADALRKLGEDMVAPTKIVEEFVKLRTTLEGEENRLREALSSLIERLEEATQHSAEEAKAQEVVADTVRDASRQLATALTAFTARTEFLERVMYQLRSLLERLEQEGLRPSGGPVRDNIEMGGMDMDMGGGMRP